MATELALERKDKSQIGSFAETQAIVQDVFPSVKFGWTTSGREKLHIAAERNIQLPPAIRESLENLPSLLEGMCEGDGWAVEFGLGYQEPVLCLYVTPRGDSDVLERGLSAIAAAVGGDYVISGNETNRLTR
jgi:hypothetical protein